MESSNLTSKLTFLLLEADPNMDWTPVEQDHIHVGKVSACRVMSVERYEGTVCRVCTANI